MHFMSNPPEAGHEPRPDEDSKATWDEARRRQAAVSFLEAAATTQNQATRTSLRRQAAALLSPKLAGRRFHNRAK